MVFKKNKVFAISIALLLVTLFGAFFLFSKSKQLPNFRKNIPSTKSSFEMPEITTVSIPNKTYSLIDYGAKNDGETKNTESFKRAIADCASQGGGKVVVPEGVWLTGPIHLKDNVELHLEKGSEIKFTDDFADYLPPVFSRFEGVELYNYSPFIYAKDCQNVALTGEGRLNGQSGKWQKWNYSQELVLERYKEGGKLGDKDISLEKLFRMGEENIPLEKRIFGTEKDALPPSFVQFVNCDRALIEGISIESSPSWTIHPLYSRNLTIKSVTVKTGDSNTDGVVLDSCENVLVENSTFDTGDDAIVIKSGRDFDGRRVNHPSRNILIRNCSVEGGHSGVAIGSEMSGGVSNVLAENIQVKYVDYGIRLKSTPGRGGIVENIFFKNIQVDRAKSDAIRIDSEYKPPLPDYDPEALPVFKNIEIDGFSCRRTKNAIYLNGLEKSPLENITVKNLKVSSAKKKLIKNYVKNLQMEDVDINVD